jgi:hypothetical protein
MEAEIGATESSDQVTALGYRAAQYVRMSTEQEI